MPSFEERAARVAAVSAAEGHMERTRRIVAMLGALGLGIGMGAAVAETRSVWVISGALIFTIAMMVEAIVMNKQLKRSLTQLEKLTRQSNETT